MSEVFALTSLAAGLGAFVCAILVVVQMFRRRQTAVGVACILLFFLVGTGVLFAFVYGWLKAGEWNIKRLMWAFTGCIVAVAVFYSLALGSTGLPLATL